MISDTELKVSGYKILNEKLGEVLAERFISLLQREKFDYTEWQRNLWNDLSVEELSKKAMEFREKNNKK